MMERPATSGPIMHWYTWYTSRMTQDISTDLGESNLFTSQCSFCCEELHQEIVATDSLLEKRLGL